MSLISILVLNYNFVSGSLAVLKLSMVTPDDSGEYTVVAENAFGKVSCCFFLAEILDDSGFRCK